METKAENKEAIKSSAAEAEIIKAKDNLCRLFSKFIIIEKENRKLRKMVYKKFRFNRRENENFYKLNG